jgi:CAAX prenyl protease-like protein
MVAHVLPMLFFALLLGLGQLAQRLGGPFWLAAPQFWIYPVQTLLCGGAIILFRRDYEFHGLRRPILVVAIGLFVFLLWIAPQQFLHFPPRREGFNLEVWAANPLLYWSTLILRFLRLVIVVPLLEEIFWRAFLLRYLISENFASVPFGSFSWLSFCAVTIGFAFSHSMADWPAAIVTGALYNLVAYRTHSLLSCVATHGLTNLALGLWIVSTRQWGFW